jgi:pentatricopeptide repeat protein
MVPKKPDGRIKATASRRGAAASNATLQATTVDVEAPPSGNMTVSTEDNLHARFLSRLEEMNQKKNRGENLTQEYCDSVLALCVASDEWDSVLDVLDVMKNQGLSQERSTYRACFQACFEVGNGASARAILNAMRQALVRPDPVDISLVVAAMCRNEHTESGWWRKALNLLRSTAEEALQGDSPVPVEAYDAVLTSMDELHWKESLKLLREMEQGLVNPDEPTFHPSPTVSTYRAVIENCVEARQTEAAVQILLGMPSKGITVSLPKVKLMVHRLVLGTHPAYIFSQLCIRLSWSYLLSLERCNGDEPFSCWMSWIRWTFQRQ